MQENTDRRPYFIYPSQAGPSSFRDPSTTPRCPPFIGFVAIGLNSTEEQNVELANSTQRMSDDRVVKMHLESQKPQVTKGNVLLNSVAESS